MSVYLKAEIPTITHKIFTSNTGKVKTDLLCQVAGYYTEAMTELAVPL